MSNPQGTRTEFFAEDNLSVEKTLLNLPDFFLFLSDARRIFYTCKLLK